MDDQQQDGQKGRLDGLTDDMLVDAIQRRNLAWRILRSASIDDLQHQLADRDPDPWGGEPDEETLTAALEALELLLRGDPAEARLVLERHLSPHYRSAAHAEAAYRAGRPPLPLAT